VTSKASAIGGLITLILIGVLLTLLFVFAWIAITVNPFMWIAVFGTATGLVIDMIAALVFIGGRTK
jgi:hypothetical protein